MASQAASERAAAPAAGQDTAAAAKPTVGHTFDRVEFAVPVTRDLLENAFGPRKFNLFERITLSVIAAHVRACSQVSTPSLHPTACY